jgi:hypothetical protein
MFKEKDELGRRGRSGQQVTGDNIWKRHCESRDSCLAGTFREGATAVVCFLLIMIKQNITVEGYITTEACRMPAFQSPRGMASSSSLKDFQFSAPNSAYLTRSCDHSWCILLTLYWDAWKCTISSRTHSLMKTPRACWSTIDCLSCA